jgi:hypothetical protein
MIPDQNCVSFIEELSGWSPASPQCHAHLAVCPTCHESAATIRLLTKEASAYSPATTGAMTAGVLDRLPFAQGAAVPTSTPRTPQVMESTPGLWLAFITGCLIIVITGALWMALVPEGLPPAHASSVQITKSLPAAAVEPPAGLEAFHTQESKNINTR